ncbi:hypothetical protein NSB25_14810 [Acetatifactor muris]|uniref:Uncharacterized protein n=1 Tax=Acetatifactor muris TaxID=879566 RepID=A0A2K4ZIU9_9FIRM|nr:hypothetical protein [Acetatifactor muris]MCR2048557.1 hypothetical protein [Acetatifactor muris]SOY30394.1 hypothetical protein AMURIS_03121 [Acetatifactor muris]
MKEIQRAEDIWRGVQELGFLPFFQNGIKGFSVEEWTPRQLWFSEREPGPWEWKGPLFPKFNYLTPQNFGEDASQSVMGTQMGASYAGILAIPVVCGILGQRFCMGIFRGFLRSWEGS